MDRPTSKKQGPDVSAPEPHIPTSGDSINVEQTPIQSSFLSGADLAALACDAHAADQNPDKNWLIRQSMQALEAALTRGPCSMARARFEAGLSAPANVDGRAVGAASMALSRAGKIERAGWFEPSPWPGCHVAPGRVWRLPTVRP